MKLQATVVKGVQIGAKFGVATANLELSELPEIEEGVYLVTVLYEDKNYGALMHFGPRKTFGGDFSAEVHILDFAKDIYGEKLEIELGGKLREVQQFKNADSLFTQIERDITQARKYFMRQNIRDVWATVSLSEQARLTEVALKHLTAEASFLEAETVFSYAPLMNREIMFVAPLMEAFPEKRYAFPKVVDDKMLFVAVDSYEDLARGAYGILEPNSGKSVEPAKGDLVLVPAVAADKTGNRLGNGKGYYDRYLSALTADPRRMAVLPDFAVVEKVPVESHDETVDKVIVCH